MDLHKFIPGDGVRPSRAPHASGCARHRALSEMAAIGSFRSADLQAQARRVSAEVESVAFTDLGVVITFRDGAAVEYVAVNADGRPTRRVALAVGETLVVKG